MENVAATGNSIFSKLAKNSDYLVAVGVISVIMIMLIPLPTIILDLLLVLNIGLAVIILMVAMYTEEAVNFSVFPGLLLIITLFRLSLNIASTRLILSEAEAGTVIEAFGTFVTKGNAIVGFIIFIILVIVQFVVITKGSGRIAEVAARFTLDAMPGKQMAVDADLNAGLITEDQARERRDKIRRESDFYGSMDGASKFVRGDAVAGIIITLINVVAGFIIGMAKMDMPFSEALSTYTQLTIGDGLVSQTPALIISTASGIIVSRAGTKANLGNEVTTQLTQSPKALFIASGVLSLLAIVPGFPAFPFIILAFITGGVGFGITKGFNSKPEEEKDKEATEAEENAAPAEEKIESYLNIDQMEMEIGYGLIPLVDKSQGGDLLERITMIRRQCASELGIIVPPIRIRDNIQLRPNDYSIKIKGSDIGSGELMPGSYLAMDPGNSSKKMRGVPTVEPAFGLPAIWITESQKEEAELSGYTVVELPAVLATHLTEVIKRNSSRILTRQDAKQLVDNYKETNPSIVEDLIPEKFTLGELHKILQNLLSEKVSVRDLGTILETISDYCTATRDTYVLTEYTRDALSRQICEQYKNADNIIPVITLDPKLEQLLETSLQQSEKGTNLILQPELTSKILDSIGQEISNATDQNEQPIIICSPLLRQQIRKMTENHYSDLVVISYNEIIMGVNIKSMGNIKVDEDENKEI